MLRRCINYSCILTVLLMVGVVGAFAESTPGVLDSYAAASLDASPSYKAISKVKPSEPAVTKVRPGFMSRFEGLSRFNPANWGKRMYSACPGPRAIYGRTQSLVREGSG